MGPPGHLELSLPQEVADDLIRSGDAVLSSGAGAERRRTIETRGRRQIEQRSGAFSISDATAIYGAVTGTASLVVAMAANPEALKRLGRALAVWRRKQPEGVPYRLDLRGPGGTASMSLSEPPDEDAIIVLMRQAYRGTNESRSPEHEARRRQ